MGWRFRKSFKILPGVRLNFGKKGFTSATFGGKYFKTNVSRRGTYNTFSLPGTGISYRAKAGGAPSQKVNAVTISGHCWTCRCSMINLPENENCEWCGVLNPTLARERYGLDWYCGRCYKANPANSQFCGECGGQKAARSNFPTPPRLGEKDSTRLMLIVIGIVGAAFVFNIFGSLVQNVNKPTVSPTKTISSNPVNEDEPQSVKETPTAKQTVNAASTPYYNKAAAATSENTNLRTTPSTRGKIIQTVAQHTDVEVVQQKAGWFFVRVSGNVGWLQGNTIRFADSIPAKAESVESLEPGNTYSADSYSSYPSPNPSYSHGSSYGGSSYKSYAPKTVRVQSYYRKDGTYVRSHYRSRRSR